jgi:hypothetical protein
VKRLEHDRNQHRSVSLSDNPRIPTDPLTCVTLENSPFVFDKKFNAKKPWRAIIQTGTTNMITKIFKNKTRAPQSFLNL